ncbi:restriction endonuclease [Deinococcus aetherius]|uniref:restriction endonuclease n=1 Tax=Deinococcus aetherius TaxID=200252 RepID=UPI00222F03B1|nr:restriction endonuclease [Deinococcus aetherius]
MTLPAAPQALAPLPTWLSQPVGRAMNPPVHTRLQELPYHELSWQDFERLCLCLAQRDAAVEGCRLYGEQGDAQAGIDLYARELDGEQYVVYQCKRVEDFGPARIKAAVEKFLEEDGFVGRDRTSAFVLCTMESLRGKQRDDMFREQQGCWRPTTSSSSVGTRTNSTTCSSRRPRSWTISSGAPGSRPFAVRTRRGRWEIVSTPPTSCSCARGSGRFTRQCSSNMTPAWP